MDSINPIYTFQMFFYVKLLRIESSQLRLINLNKKFIHISKRLSFKCKNIVKTLKFRIIM
jgi:hypothetical protein